MKEKNKKMIIVVTSLLLVVGVSLAYFTASTIFGGNGTTVTGKTVAPQGSELIVEGTLEFNDLDIYPGHQNVSSTKVTATGDNELIPYNIIFNGINTLNTPLNYTVYKTSGSIDVSASCEKKNEVMGGAKIYYEECTISNIESLGSPVSSGSITTSEENSKTTLVKDEFITSSPTTEEVYYYVVLEYPNLEESQNIDMGGTFTGEVTIEISDVEPDINIIAAYIEQEDGSYEQVSDIPQEGYVIDTEKSVCSNGATPTGTTPNITINNLSKSGTSCYLYFDEQLSAAEIILVGKDIQIRTDFSTPYVSTTTNTVFQTTDWKGTSYYFAGAPTDNWVRFGGFYWRIVRVNGDGTVRLIYNGTGTATTGEGTVINSSQPFNSNYGRSEYVGLKYTEGEQHGQNTDSPILDVLQSWYSSSGLSATEYSKYIDTNVGFCSDRNIVSENWSSTSIHDYAVYERLETNKNPSLACTSSDIIKEPVGLITADEVAFSGGGTFANTSYYLYNNQVYWTMTPSRFPDSYTYHARVAHMTFNGSLVFGDSVVNPYGVRPVINLDKNVTISSGDGTIDNPYVVGA